MTFDEWLSQQGGNVDVDCGCVSTETFMNWLRVAYDAGNSPAIPDGWALVPIEPTQEMLDFGSCYIEDGFSDLADAYKAMLLASVPMKNADSVTDNTAQQFESLSKRSVL